jgi:Pvc16 N-terminal domain
MSNSLAIAAVTATLKSVLQALFDRDQQLTGTQVTILPLDKARKNAAGNQLNLFLYQVQRSAAWTNMDMPRQVRQGETAVPPLPLNLYYLLTPFGQDDDTSAPFSHAVLGKAMSILHDYSMLDPADVKNAASGPLLATSDLDQQIERVRITFQPMSIEDLSKLWTGFASEYRLSAAYEVAVTLIESTRPARTPLPVLTRGRQDSGVTAVASPPPSLTEVLPPAPFAAVRLGDDISLNGQQLNNDSFIVRFRSPVLSAPNGIAPKTGGTATQIAVHLAGHGEDADALIKWAPGHYMVSLVIKRPNLPAWPTSEVPMALAPVITVAPNSAPAGDVILTITCVPRVREGQRVFLLFGDRPDRSPIPVQSSVNPADTSQPTTLTFLVPAATAGSHVVRLRVDGVDSQPAVITGTPPKPAFDAAQKVTVR